MTVAEWHDKILESALAWRREHPEFRFNLRSSDVTGKQRLNAGYWFTGNDDYLFFAPFRPNDPNNKTRTVGFVIGFDRDGAPRRCCLEIVFGATTDPKLRATYNAMLTRAPFTKVGNDKYQYDYAESDPTIAFQTFLSDDLPNLQPSRRNARCG